MNHGEDNVTVVIAGVRSNRHSSRCRRRRRRHHPHPNSPPFLSRQYRYYQCSTNNTAEQTNAGSQSLAREIAVGPLRGSKNSDLQISRS